MSKRFSIRARLRSFLFAFQGIRALVSEEHNFRVHLVAAALAIGLGAYLRISPADWRWIIGCIGLVLTAEAFNSAIERLTDLRQPDYDPKAGRIKDIAAGAVLLTAVTALVIGIIIFWPHLSALTSH
jgi:diacylglycerol kinase